MFGVREGLNKFEFSMSIDDTVPGDLICGEDLDFLVASGEGKIVELDIQCCGQGKGNTCNRERV